MSPLGPLLAQFDLRLVCEQCSVAQREISYQCKDLQHQCGLSLLLCRAKGSSLWRPVSSRPTFPNPNHYEVCWFFKEDSGCTQHRKRCSFARSVEEAAVWTFEKKLQIHHLDLCKLVAQLNRTVQPKTDRSPDLTVAPDLKAACEQCCIRDNEITYTTKTVIHKCRQNLLLAKDSAAGQWRPVAERPATNQPGPKVQYQVCEFFKEGSGCSKDGQSCTFARSSEEAFVWNYVRDKQMQVVDLIRAISEPEMTTQHAAQTLLQLFPGHFSEFCKQCFNDQPPKLAVKKWNNTCSADAAHQWQPLLIHHPAERGKRLSQVRPLTPKSPLEFCSHVRDGKPCWHNPGHCPRAQSEVEMEVWRAERDELKVRPLLLQLQPQPNIPQVSWYCRVCFLSLSSAESFYKHCSSVEHAQLLRQDTSVWWRGRPPPHTRRADFWLCDRPQTCEYGRSCPKAHSVGELQEWMMRTEEVEEICQNIQDQGLMSYNDRLLHEYRASSNEVHIMSEQVDDVTISSDEDLTLSCEQVQTKLQWSFQIETERQLVHVALLKQEPGACFSLDDSTSDPCIYSPGHAFLTNDSTYHITVSFRADVPGRYEQWFVLDFNMRPVLLQKLRVTVCQAAMEEVEEDAVTAAASSQSSERWHRGNRVIVPCVSRTEEQEELLKLYKPPHVNFLYKPDVGPQTALTHQNYKERMHHFLYSEERAEDLVVSRLNVCGEMMIMDHTTLWGIEGRELFGAISLPYSLTADSPEGLAIRRSIQSALVAPSSSGANSKIYEVFILQDQTTENVMYLQLSKRCCFDLGLKRNTSRQMEVQFQMNRYHFCSLHRAVDLLPDTRRVLPDLEKCSVPVSNVLCDKLNTKQQVAVGFITGTADDQKCVAPLLIYGPFGTGKTFTLATAAKELCQQPHNKVLLCTHTNSSADLYVRDHFHPCISENLKPLRIKANTGRGLHATDEVTLKYCLLNETRDKFLTPTKAILDQHNIIIITNTMARYLHGLGLVEGYFSHILMDEASQMLECEALSALGLAGPCTRVALAGDHMQMGPKLFSVDDHRRSDHTILTRLFHYYQVHQCDAALRSRIILSENYRSTREIVDFVSTHFYTGKGDVIKASDTVAPPANGHALRFWHVRGESLLDRHSMSWYNSQEATAVVHAVREVLQYWSSAWGSPEPQTICILSEGYQVKKIRTELSKKGLSKVQVQNLANVQGLQFRVIIVSAVHTRDSLKTCHLSGLELFTDARVFNTALTRAQSLVLVCADAAALCCFGQCSQIWKNYVDYCIHNNSVDPRYFTKDFFENDLMEIKRFQKPGQIEENSSDNDAILQELKSEYEALNKKLLTDDPSVNDHHDEDDHGVNDHHDEDDHHGVDNQHCMDDHHRLNDQHPGHQNADDSSYEADSESSHTHNKQIPFCGHGKLVRESPNRGYVIPSTKPHVRIKIKRRANLGRTFTGDEVLIEKGKVIGITHESQRARELVCYLEDEGHSKNKKTYTTFTHTYIRRTMVPLTKSAPKISILINKKKRHDLPVWEQTAGYWEVVDYKKLDEKFRQNHVFVVQVIKWKEGCCFPLGNVISVLPIGSSLTQDLQILNREYKVSPMTREPKYCEDKNKSHRKDRRCRITFTVDPPKSKDLDDAISIEDNGEQYELGIHIADVASFVALGDTLDEEAKQRCVTYYCNRNPEQTMHMFPEALSTGRFSLLPNKDRCVVSLLFKVNRQTSQVIGEPEFEFSTIRSDKQYSYEEAEQSINQRLHHPMDHSLRLAYEFAKAQRKERLNNWPYAQSDQDRVPGQRKSHLMIEELSILFNSCVSQKLITSDATSRVVPLRCQPAPDQEKMIKLQEQHADLIPVSFCLWHKVNYEEQTSHEAFSVLQHIWKNIRDAANADDIDRMVDLICADDIHPQLQPVTSQFRKCLNKAFFVCSSLTQDFRHYSLNLEQYTMASSPIRRYIDVVLHRLLHCHILRSHVPYSQAEITALCKDFDKNAKEAKEYERKAENISFAVGVRKQSVCKMAFVVKVDPETDSFLVAFPFNTDMFTDRISVLYKNLQLNDQPCYDETSRQMTLMWKRRIYAANKEVLHQELRTRFHSGPCVEIPFKDWMSIVEAIKEENWDQAKTLIKNTMTEQESPQTTVKSISEEKEEHEVEVRHLLKAGDTVRVQMTCEVRRGYLTPAIQLLSITPKFELCVDHTHNPITCFSKYADNHSQIHYQSTDDYVRIWRPLCEMESAASAVRESDSIVIEKLEVNFSQRIGNRLSGSFFLHSEWIEAWAIQCDLSKCLLCIRKQGLELKREMLEKHKLLDFIKSGDPREFSWVMHGVTTNVEVKKGKSLNGTTVHFYVSHLPMEDIPDCVFNKKTTFTVELIPKMLPDIRKESAVVNVPIACDLVKRIALGHRIPREVLSRPTVRRHELPNRLPHLNQRQFEAVDKALNNTFTLIQGPPGTGKTVVGVYIVHCFSEMNKESPRKFSADSKDKNKKQVILYCGPSHKSVDVVAEYLLRFKDLSVLRVYGQQVEMLEYPDPECWLQFSSKTRPEPSNPKLRSITLHHRIRESPNPSAHQIREFDERIRTAHQNGHRQHFTAEEVKAYNNLLNDARKYELERHDIILCTCTMASSLSLTKTVSARQILIDECAMATEPEALVPLVSNNPEKIILIGDHKQLRPVLINNQVKKLGMAMSLFERYYTVLEKRSVMLKIQYRMHQDICEFPSQEYYEGQLQTGVEQPSSLLRLGERVMPVVFGDVRGVTVRQVTNTAKGNVNSKANHEETEQVVDIAEKLVEIGEIKQEDIVILSPYNAQVSEIRDTLKEKGLTKINVNTITKSQGSEWRYVIISTVCSVPEEEIMAEPDRQWFSEHVGFVSDPNQINVGITRAKEGLCIIGNQALLRCSRAWGKLLKHYTAHGAVTEARRISVCPRP